MPVYLLDDTLWFPEPDEFDSDIVAVGGDLRPERLLDAYSRGIFPWYNEPGEIHWWCPSERCVLYTNEFHISHSLRNTLNKNHFQFTFDTAFNEVIEGCREGIRHQHTWILDEMVEAYKKLHLAGLAHSVEVWENGTLAGGLYGVSLGRVFYGESMFSRSKDSSKAALYFLAKDLEEKGWKLIDCQVENDHLVSLGARVITREKFLEELETELKYPTVRGKWNTDQES